MVGLSVIAVLFLLCAANVCLYKYQLRPEAVLQCKFELAEQIKQELILLISRIKACSFLDLSRQIQEHEELTEDLESLRRQIMVVDDDDLLIIGQLYDLFEESCKELARLGVSIALQIRDVFEVEATRLAELLKGEDDAT
ncbi:MAG: hypothetical protein Q8P54_02440 [bacterium]|nr:hypothetical protein [bacterium]